MLINSNGISVDVINYGGIIMCIEMLDVKGEMGNIVLGLDNLEVYIKVIIYYGVIIGCFGNCIVNGKFILNGIEY